tara:strand:+ start:725 stop:1948 length:1224 start_codon:yes stop_codon:yes gene_type:complete
MEIKKKILLIVGGGISAYKSLDLVRLLKKNNYEIKTVLTKSGKEFVTPLSLISLTGGKVYEDIFDKTNEAEIDHISLSRWADLILVIPTTANLISKLSYGKADDLASTLILASNKDIFLVPAMNVRMWSHAATRNNCETLKGYGYKFIGPIKGEMACGEYGDGKMSSPKEIFDVIRNYFNNKNILKKNNFSAIVTAGPTREYIDPIRYLSNESSGKQGYEVALALSKAGIKTTLILGPTNMQPLNGIKIINVKSAEDMFLAVKKHLPVDIVVCSAAVADFKPKKFFNKKLKKGENFKSLNLTKTYDILEFLGKNNKHRPKIVIGFSAETDNLIQNSIKKLREKNSDFIVANDISQKGVGFNVDYNEVSIIDQKGNVEKIKKSKKSFIATVIAEKIIKKLLVDDKNFN